MNGTLYSIRKFLAVLLVGFLFFGVKPNGAAPHTPIDEENCRLSAFIASDAHIEGNRFDRVKNFCRMLTDMKNTSRENDAVVFLGDNTMNGQHIESMLFYGSLGKVSPAKNAIVTIGNHDVGNGSGDYNELIGRYRAYNKMFLNADIDEPYFCRIINGYRFIVLGTEDSTSNTMAVSDEQLAFLEKTMKEASADGKPIFVFNHYPVDREDGDKLYSIFNLLNDYKNVFYIYGHMHAALSADTLTRYGNVRLLSIPMFTSINSDDETGEDSGVAFALEAYDDKVVFRARDCYDGKWLENYFYSFPLE